MGFFSSSKKIPASELDHILRDVVSLTPSERQYVLGVFSQYRSGNISKREIKLAIKEMKRNGNDRIGYTEANNIRDALLDALQ